MRQSIARSLASVGVGAALALALYVSAGGAPPPAIDHILLEVKDVERSLRFYRDALGLPVESRHGDFVILKTANGGIALWGQHWEWSPPAPEAGPRPPAGVYPHLAVKDVRGLVAKLKKAGYNVIGKPEWHTYGTEAFVADPDGYVWAFITAK